MVPRNSILSGILPLENTLLDVSIGFLLEAVERYQAFFHAFYLLKPDYLKLG